MSVCRSCNAEILWAVTAPENGKRIPLNLPPVSDGNIEITGRTQLGAAVVTVHGQPPLMSSGDLYVSHFATCPDAGTWRTK